MRVTLPVRTVSEANSHEHWRARQKRAKAQRSQAYLTMRWQGGYPPPELPLRVLLTRVAPSSGLDSDNLPSSMKHLRDGIADWLGIDDRDPGVEWSYAQERGAVWGVRVEVTEGAYP